MTSVFLLTTVRNSDYDQEKILEDLGSLVESNNILSDFHFIPERKSNTLVYKFGSNTAHSPYSEGLTTMGAGTAIYYFTQSGTLGTIFAFVAGEPFAFLKSYNNGIWTDWMKLIAEITSV